MAVYKILEEIINERGLSVADIARICNLPDSTVRGIIRRKQETIALEVAFKISNGLGVSLEKLNGMPEKGRIATQCKKAPPYSEEALKLAGDYDSLDGHGKRVVRLVTDEEKARCTASAPTKQPEPEKVIYIFPGYTSPMSAGTGQTAESDYPEELELTKRPPRGTSYVAPINGNSMEPTYHSGDKLFIHACEEIEPGQIGVFFMDGQQWVKELGDGVLISHNPNYLPRPMTEDIRCQGLVLGVCDDSYFE